MWRLALPLLLLASWLLVGMSFAQAYTHEVYGSVGAYRWKIANVERGSSPDLATAITNCVWQSSGVREIHVLVGGDLSSTIGLPPDVSLFCHGNSFTRSHGGIGIYCKGVNNIGVYDMTLSSGTHMGIQTSGCSNVTLSGITVLSGFIGIRVDSHPSRPGEFWSYDLTVKNCRFENLGSHGLETYGIDGAIVDNIVARNNGECGVLFNRTKNATVGTVDAYRCCYGGGYAGLRFANGCSDNRVKYLRAIECGRGFFTVSDARNIIVEEVYIRNSSAHNILLQNSDGVGINSGSYNGGGLYHYTSINSWILAKDVTNVASSPPPAPSTPAISASSTGLVLNWAVTHGADNYLLQRATVSGGPYRAVAYLDTPTFTDRNVVAGTTYFYVVKGVNAAGPGGASAEGSASAVSPAVDLGSGLRYYFPFDGSLANVETGGSLSLAGPANFANGLIDRSLDLDGTANYGMLPPMAGSSLRNFSVAAWIWNDIGTNWQRIFDFGSSTSNYMILTRVYDTFRYEMYLGNSRQAFEVQAPPLNRWAHVAITFSGNWATLYINGQAEKSIFFSYNPSQFSLSQNFIGKSRSNDPLFDGRLDDLRIYDRGISSMEVGALVSNAPSLPPTDLIAGAFGTRVNLNWTGVVNASTYTVKRAPTSGGPYAAVASGIIGTTFSDTDVQNGASYHYIVTATNPNGESADSNEATAVVSDLVARVTFNEISGNAAPDSSGNSWNASLINGPTNTAGPMRNAIRLANTAGQHATFPNGVVGGLNDYTICLWVRVSTLTSWARIFDFGTGTTNYMFLTPQYATGDNAAKLRFAIRTSTVNEQVINSSTALAPGTWAHVALTLTGNTGRLYLNGNLVGTNPAMTLKPSSLGSTTLNYLGKSQFNDPYLDGSVDDLRIYCRALAAGEIVALANPSPTSPAELSTIPDDGAVTLRWQLAEGATVYNIKRSTQGGGPYTTVASGVVGDSYTDGSLSNNVRYFYIVTGSNPSGESTTSSPEANVVPTTLRLHLKFDESSGTSSLDSSGRGGHALLVNGPVHVSGKIDDGLNFTQSNAQYASLPSGVVSGLTTSTIMCWLKISSTTSWQRIFDFGTTPDNFMFLTTQYATGGTSNRLRFSIRTPGVPESAANQINSSLTTPVGSWVHVAVVLDGSTGTLYLNGTQVGQAGSMTLNPSSLGVTTSNFIGKSRFNDPYLNGAVDDFRIYTRAFDRDEIALFTHPLPPPQNLVAIAASNSINLQWSPVADATGYTVKVSDTAVGPYQAIATGLDQTGYSDTPLNAGQRRFYVVTASNITGVSPDSIPVSSTVPMAPISDSELLPPDLKLNSNGTATLTIHGTVMGRRYHLESSEFLTQGTWEEVGEPINGSGTDHALTIPLEQGRSRRFFRLRIETITPDDAMNGSNRDRPSLRGDYGDWRVPAISRCLPGRSFSPAIMSQKT